MKTSDLVTGMGTFTIYKQIKQGKFPAQIQIGEKRVAWLKCEILDWIMNKAINRKSPTNT